MTAASWWLVIGGAIFTIASLLAFLFALTRGLRTQRWGALGTIVALWVFAMAAYSLWDGEERREQARERATAVE